MQGSAGNKEAGGGSRVRPGQNISACESTEIGVGPSAARRGKMMYGTWDALP